MGYYIRELKNKRQLPHWKVQFLSYKKVDIKDSTAKRPRKEWDISKERWSALGFQPSMSSDQAKARAKQLNAQRASKRQEERRKKFDDVQRNLNQKFTASIPELYKEEFELKYLTGRFQNTGWKKRFLTSWNAAQKMLIEIQLDPVDWYDNYYLLLASFSSTGQFFVSQLQPLKKLESELNLEIQISHKTNEGDQWISDGDGSICFSVTPKEDCYRWVGNVLTEMGIPQNPNELAVYT